MDALGGAPIGGLMKEALDWGIGVILLLQQLSPALDTPFELFTWMGNKTFFLVFLPFVYWCVDRKVGAGLTLLFLLSACVNAAAKELIGQPRPFLYDPRVIALVPAHGFGLPSGHTQSAMVVWGFLAARLRKAWVWGLAGAMIVLIPLSRVYLGVHFPTDLLGGYLLGGALLAGYLFLEPRGEAWLVGRGLTTQLSVAFLLPLLVVLLLPVGVSYGIAAGASLMGMGLGFALERRWVRFEAGGPAWQRALRLAAGVAVLAALRFGLMGLFQGLEPEPVFSFVRYLALGLAGAVGAPWMFVRMRLASRA